MHMTGCKPLSGWLQPPQWEQSQAALCVTQARWLEWLLTLEGCDILRKVAVSLCGPHCGLAGLPVGGISTTWELSRHANCWLWPLLEQLWESRTLF